MKTIGLIGGMSAESSADYYRYLNHGVNRRLGGHHNAKSVMVTVDFAEIERLQRAGEWDEQGRMLAEAARTLEKAGADCAALCTNTMHLVAGHVEEAISIPLVHLVDATADAIRAEGLGKVALLGTAFTMEHGFYQDRMSRHGIEILTPGEDGRGEVHRAVYEELTRGVVLDATRERFLEVIEGLRERGAEGVILGCTEIGMLIKPEHTDLPVFDSALVHAEALAEFAVGT
ncbi:aspartate/glutamate racemase family protein [Salininema proteolyticum]|uniref:Aspartate/glutamate racemase family protein n=1 Tax=Salininema proteolyticum TaxID=1607685 RepID=A0ABV8TTZ8_9ACTN